jgi:hypothetical protein
LEGVDPEYNAAFPHAEERLMRRLPDRRLPFNMFADAI